MFVFMLDLYTMQEEQIILLLDAINWNWIFGKTTHSSLLCA